MPSTTVTARTSQSHPLQISSINTPGGGRIGLTFCPGKKDPRAMTGAWDRDLDADLEAIRQWGASTLVTLMERHELEALHVPELGEAAETTGLEWLHLPIRDVSIPDKRFEARWSAVSAKLLHALGRDESIVIHCKGGLGRTGLVAAMLLVQQGMSPGSALLKVREVRPGAIETREQEDYLHTQPY